MLQPISGHGVPPTKHQKCKTNAHTNRGQGQSPTQAQSVVPLHERPARSKSSLTEIRVNPGIASVDALIMGPSNEPHSLDSRVNRYEITSI